mgnify:CR=1 FL=1
MKTIRTISIVSFVIGMACYTIFADENDYWPTIKELLKKETPQEGNPELEKYLKTLTKEQLLTALRQYCRWVDTQPLNHREWAEVVSMQIMLFYSDPLKRSDLSDEEYERIKKRGDADELESGHLPGRLSDEEYDILIAGLADPKEGAYFRWTLAVLFCDDEYYFPVLSKSQRDRYFDACLAVATNRESPDMVRTGCLEALWKVFSREYRHIIYKDDVVKKLMGSGSPEEERYAKSLIDSGKIDLTSKTLEQLRPWRDRILDFRKILVALQENEQETEMIKKNAKRQLHWLDRFPLINSHTTTSVLRGQGGFPNEAVVKGLMSSDRSVRKTAEQQAEKLSKKELITLARDTVDDEKLRLRQPDVIYTFNRILFIASKKGFVVEDAMTLLEATESSKYVRIAILDWINEVGGKAISTTDAVNLVPRFDRILLDQQKDLDERLQAHNVARNLVWKISQDLKTSRNKTASDSWRSKATQAIQTHIRQVCNVMENTAESDKAIEAFAGYIPYYCIYLRDGLVEQNALKSCLELALQDKKRSDECRNKIRLALSRLNEAIELTDGKEMK